MGDSTKGTNVRVHGGIGFTAALLLLLIALKLTGVIAQVSWWWVLAPLWLTPLILGLMLTAAFFAAWVQVGRENRAAERARLRHDAGLPTESDHGPDHRWGRHQ